MRHVHRIKKETEQEAQHPKPELRQGELALEGGHAEAPRPAETVMRDTAGKPSPDRGAAPDRHLDTVPPVEAEDYPWAHVATAQEDVPPPMPSPDRAKMQSESAVTPPDSAAPLTDTEPAKPDWLAPYEAFQRDWNELIKRVQQNRGAVILRQRVHGHDPAHPGAGGEPGYRGRDTGAHARGARKSPTGSLGAEARRGLS